MIRSNVKVFLLTIMVGLMLSGCVALEALDTAADLIDGGDGGPSLEIETEIQKGGENEEVQGLSIKDETSTTNNIEGPVEKLDNSYTEADTATSVKGPVESIVYNQQPGVLYRVSETLLMWANLAMGAGIGLFIGWLIKRPQTMLREHRERKQFIVSN